MFYSNKKVLVTGGTGFIGSHLVRALLGTGACIRVPVHVRQMQPDISNVETVFADLMRWEGCRAAARGVDYVIHAAGTVGAAGVKDYQLMEGITKNLVLTAHMLQAAWAEGVKKIVVFGSSTGYPAYSHPVREEEMWLDEPHPAYAGYGWMRRYIEKLGEYVSGQSECKVVIIRPSAVYGPGDNFMEKTSHVIPALIKRAVGRENPFVVWGTGDEVRDFIHVSDFARACLLALAKCNDFDPINIGAGKGSAIREVVGLILEAVGHKDVQIFFDGTKPATIPFRMVSIEKARQMLDFEPQIPLEEGIRDTVKWYMSTLTPPIG
ncbi:MAG: NAD-dependent epimerase/dehydratase family protein [Deltaproteobacteria bacterium]|nr:MAG: NAD-dependent epimerase/dehydratase family protein [Deltaproteobacteria bacterium]